MGEAGRPERVGHVGRLIAHIAQRQSEQQAGVPLRQRPGAVHERPPQAVRHPADGIAAPPADHVVDHQTTGQVPVRQAPLDDAGRLQTAHHHDPLTGQPLAEGPGGRASGVRPVPPLLPADLDDDAAPPVGRGIAHQRDLAADRAGLHRRPQPLEGPAGEGGRQAGGTHAEQRRVPPEQGDCRHRARDEQPRRRHVAVDHAEGAGGDRHREGDGPPIAHPAPETVTRSRS